MQEEQRQEEEEELEADLTEQGTPGTTQPSVSIKHTICWLYKSC